MLHDFSEDGCSTWITENLPLPTTGTYVDVGCAHSLSYSQTAFLRERGWTGIAIDANEDYKPEWEGLAGVQFVYAVVSHRRECNFLFEPTNSLVSREHPTGKLTECHTLDSILIAADVTKIDFLSIDCESMEYDALLSLSLDKYPPIIVSEYNSCHAGQDFRVLHHLVKMGYEVKHVTGSNIVYFRP